MRLALGLGREAVVAGLLFKARELGAHDKAWRRGGVGLSATAEQTSGRRRLGEEEDSY